MCPYECRRWESCALSRVSLMNNRIWLWSEIESCKGRLIGYPLLTWSHHQPFLSSFPAGNHDFSGRPQKVYNIDLGSSYRYKHKSEYPSQQGRFPVHISLSAMLVTQISSHAHTRISTLFRSRFSSRLTAVHRPCHSTLGSLLIRHTTLLHIRQPTGRRRFR